MEATYCDEIAPMPPEAFTPEWFKRVREFCDRRGMREPIMMLSSRHSAHLATLLSLAAAEGILLTVDPPRPVEMPFVPTHSKAVYLAPEPEPPRSRFIPSKKPTPWRRRPR